MNGNESSVRLASTGDAETIHSMILALGASMGEAHKIRSVIQDFERHGFGTDPLFEVFIAERDGTAVGLSLFFHTFSTWLGEPGIYVQDLYVADSERGTGLGRRLLAATAAYGHERGATHLRLTVDSSNMSARQFYEHVGMDFRDKEQSFHIGSDAFLALAGDQA